jgi:ubiquinone/menaquinone biosynthesis C-methylase UbiE
MSDPRQGVETKDIRDYREHLRKSCYLPIIELERNIKPIGNVVNISTSGLFLVTKRFKNPTDRLKAKFFLPNTSSPIDFLGEVVYVKDEGQNSFRGMGVRFIDLNGENQKALKSYILNHNFNETLKGFQIHSNSLIQNLKPFNDKKAIDSLFTSAAHEQTPAQIFWCRDYILIVTVLQDIGKHHISLKVLDKNKLSITKIYDHLYLGFTYRGTSYFFEATVKYVGSDSLTVTRPDVIYFEERRVEARYTGVSGDAVERTSVEYHQIDNGDKWTAQQIVDFSSSGLSFNLPLGDFYFSPGSVIREINVIKGGKSRRQDSAKVVHVTPTGNNHMKVGLEFHVERQPYETSRIEFHKAKEKSSFISPLIKTAKEFFVGTERILRRLLNLHPKVHLVKYLNKNGEEISAILNATFDLDQGKEQMTAPVVIIPPAFARRKETTGLLALAIVETFKKYKKNIVVIRFDGIRSVGESFNDEECKRNGNEMTHNTLTQLISDIQTTIDYTKNNPIFIPSNMVVISFSMASVATRRAILLDRGENVNYWISCMGASDPEDLIRNSTGGIDYLRLFVNGEKSSVKQVLGHMVDLDKYCHDIISNRMGYLEDSRNDMAHIEIPVTWIYGRYDYWINKNRIHDIMSVKSEGLRQVYEVASGHIVKTSSEAINVFKMISQCIWKQLYKTEIDACEPSSRQQVAMEAVEWSRIKRHELNYKNYWRSYLLGEDRHELGFDIITLTDEYQELMEKQLELLDIKETDLFIDMGGGTGNFIQAFLETCITSNKPQHWPVVMMVDFVHEALLKARNKHEKIFMSHSIVTPGFNYIEANLDLTNDSVKLPFKNNSVSKLLSSVCISYIKNPVLTLKEFFRILKPGGTIVVSSLKPDTDMSKPIHALIDKIKIGEDLPYFQDKNKEELLTAVQFYINSAAYLTDLEEEKLFKFYSETELKELLVDSGFSNIQMYETFGNPTQGIIAVGHK